VLYLASRAAIKDADQIIVLDQGQACARGTHEQLLGRQAGCTRELYRTQLDSELYFAAPEGGSELVAVTGAPEEVVLAEYDLALLPAACAVRRRTEVAAAWALLCR